MHNLKGTICSSISEICEDFQALITPQSIYWLPSRELEDTLDGRNPANHLGCTKPCKWDNLPIDQPQVVIAGFLQQYLSFGRKKTSSSSSWGPGQLGFPGDMCSLPRGRYNSRRSMAIGATSQVRFGGFFVFGGYDSASGRAPSILSRWYAHRIHWTGISTYIRGHYITYPNKALL